MCIRDRACIVHSLIVHLAAEIAAANGTVLLQNDGIAIHKDLQLGGGEVGVIAKAEGHGLAALIDDGHADGGLVALQVLSLIHISLPKPLPFGRGGTAKP